MPIRERKSFITQMLSSKLFIVVGLALLAFIGTSLAKEVARRFEVKDTVSGLNQEILALETRNQKLADLIEYFKSEAYQESQARTRLNLKKEGEGVIVLPKGEDLNSASQENGNQTPSASSEEKNLPKKWWQYFFD